MLFDIESWNYDLKSIFAGVGAYFWFSGGIDFFQKYNPNLNYFLTPVVVSKIKITNHKDLFIFDFCQWLWPFCLKRILGKKIDKLNILAILYTLIFYLVLSLFPKKINFSVIDEIGNDNHNGPRPQLMTPLFVVHEYSSF